MANHEANPFTSTERTLQYDETTPPIPHECIEALVNIAHITLDSSIIDLGCGSGGLAYGLAQYSPHVEAVDMSPPMIALAQAKYTDRQVAWICESVENFDLGRDSRKLITWMGGFHMTSASDKPELIRRCAEALVSGGVFAILSKNNSYDAVAKPILEKTFSPYNIFWDDWQFWECPDFPDLVTRAQAGLSMREPIAIARAERTTIEDIATHNLSVSRTAGLLPAERDVVYQELMREYAAVATEGAIFGYAEYKIQYCIKGLVS